MEQTTGVLRHAINDLRRRNAIRIPKNRIEHDSVFFFRQILANDSPHGRMAQAFAKFLVKIGSPDRMVTPRIPEAVQAIGARLLEAEVVSGRRAVDLVAGGDGIDEQRV